MCQGCDAAEPGITYLLGVTTEPSRSKAHFGHVEAGGDVH